MSSDVSYKDIHPPVFYQHRQQLTALQNKSYFNYGGQGPLPESALQAILNSYRQIQRLGPFSDATKEWVTQECYDTREIIAKELNVPTNTITLTENVSVGCNIALWGIPWKPGDHLLLTDCEHPGIIAAAEEISRRFQVELSVCPLLENRDNPVNTIASHARSHTKLIIISHLLWNTGDVLPQGEIVAAVRSRYPQVQFLVDAAQSVGSLPLNLAEDGIDFYAFTGHKWWCGPEGLGALYIRPEAMETLHPTYIGWRGLRRTLEGLRWQPDGRRYEVATSAYPLLAGLRSAIAFHHTWGTAEQRYEQICRSSTLLWEKLGQISGVHRLRNTPPKAGLVSFQLESGCHSSVARALDRQSIVIRTIGYPNCVRACVHYFTETAEIDCLIRGIDELARTTARD
ncbi:aminotransferase class V-fold PLP-dependent enzyme [Roseofilum casamattae]|uniref:Aminotransferase class V-fold PLP-dependent enzyme n=1 Tax=Roseofilum casamattae BLCC-M143 TaxID=3022442 RepID=A0ABT7BRE4_9CYAN|nr:aminotransferase class V-fold PLP-dependent enzyme [Roseofilum casamattae]MDJ1181772.1 aminotransferase class V-fold PLP-dependent enzyme [Roseofilum casamattae BLCC-M143]